MSYSSNTTEGDQTPMDFFIIRNVSDELTLFVEYNKSVVLSMMRAADDLSLFYNVFNLSGSPVSIHVQIRPVNLTQYVIFLKYGGLPQLNNRKIDFDYFELFCEDGKYLN